MAYTKPGTGWPGDPAKATTPVARSARDVGRLAGSVPSIEHLDARVSVCRACPRLVGWREQVASEKRAAYIAQQYWGRPVPSFGPQRAKLLVVGLAPAAHGGNRTGRMFTGDRSGDWLYAALHRAGLATQAESTGAGDGLELVDTRITAPVHCAPPGNKPTNEERESCQPWLERELAFLKPTLQSVLVLGGYGWAAIWPALEAVGYPPPLRKPVFSHGAEIYLGRGELVVYGSYHVSQQNTFTGTLTEAMLDEVVSLAAESARAGRFATGKA